MKTLDGTPIEVGLVVYLLQVPVVSGHEFKVGMVEKITAKTIHVSYTRKDRWGENENTTVYRYPEQLIARRPFKEGVVELAEAELDTLTNDSNFLNCLEGAGVDNWEGYSEACDQYREIYGEED